MIDLRKGCYKQRYKKKCHFCGKIYQGIKISLFCSSKCLEKHKKFVLKEKEINECLICKTTKNIHKHHIIMQEYHGKEVMFLCRKCHVNLHKFYKYIEKRGYKIIKNFSLKL